MIWMTEIPYVRYVLCDIIPCLFFHVWPMSKAGPGGSAFHCILQYTGVYRTIGSLVIDSTAMPYINQEYYQHIIMDLSQDPVVSNSVSPRSFELTGQCFSCSAGIIAIDKIFSNPIVDPECFHRILFLHLRQRFLRIVAVFDTIAQRNPNSFPTSSWE